MARAFGGSAAGGEASISKGDSSVKQSFAANREAEPRTNDVTTFDIYLDNVAYWRNVPEPVWNYYIGGYQVIKKWLSYREYDLLGRPLKLEEVDEVTNMIRRIAALVLMEQELNENYQRVKANTYDPSPKR